MPKHEKPRRERNSYSSERGRSETKQKRKQSKQRPKQDNEKKPTKTQPIRHTKGSQCSEQPPAQQQKHGKPNTTNPATQQTDTPGTTAAQHTQEKTEDPETQKHTDNPGGEAAGG